MSRKQTHHTQDRFLRGNRAASCLREHLHLIQVTAPWRDVVELSQLCPRRGGDLASTPGGAALAPGALRGKSRLKTRSFHPHVCLEWPGSTQSLWLNFSAGKMYYSSFILSCYDGTGVRTGAHTHTDGLRVWEGFGASRPPSSHICSPGSALSRAPRWSSVGLWRLGKWMRSGPGAGR